MGQPTKFDLALERARERANRSPIGTSAYTASLIGVTPQSAILTTRANQYAQFQTDNRESFKRAALYFGYDKPIADDMKLIDLPFTVDESDPRRNAYNERKQSPVIRHTDDTAVNGRVSVSQFDSPSQRNDAHDNMPDESLASDKRTLTYADVKRSRSTWLNFRTGINALISSVKQSVIATRDQLAQTHPAYNIGSQ